MGRRKQFFWPDRVVSREYADNVVVICFVVVIFPATSEPYGTSTISLRVVTLALGQLYDCLRAREVALKYIGNVDYSKPQQKTVKCGSCA